jgi:branched-chain amino acid transport system substrate-binding protein
MQLSRRDSLAALLAAAATLGAKAGRADEPEIVIGAPNSLTGGLGENGQRAVWGFLIAIEQTNREGGIKSLGGAKLKPIVADTTTENPTQGASVTRRMIDQDHAAMLFGATASAITLAAQVEAEKSQIPLVTGSYADPLIQRGMKHTFKLTVPGSQAWTFAMTALVDMIKAERGAPPKSAGIFMGSDAVSISVAKTLPGDAQRIGLQVVTQVNFQGNLTDPSVIVTPILQNKPETIFLSGFLSDAVLVLKTLRGLGIKTPVASAGGISTDSAGKTLGAAAKGVFMPWSWNWDLTAPGEGELNDAYKKAHADAPYPCNNEQLGMGYSSGMIIRQALEKAASRDGAKLREALVSTEFTDLPMPAKHVAFDETGQNKYAQMILTEWHEGNAHTVWPKELQAMKPAL